MNDVVEHDESTGAFDRVHRLLLQFWPNSIASASALSRDDLFHSAYTALWALTFRNSQQ
jgi:hypothetical protein